MGCWHSWDPQRLHRCASSRRAFSCPTSWCSLPSAGASCTQSGLCTASYSGWISLGSSWDWLMSKAVWGLACHIGCVVVAWRFMANFSVIMLKGIARSHRICWSFMKAFQLSNQNIRQFLCYLLSLTSSELPQFSWMLRKLVKVVGFVWFGCVFWGVFLR